MRHVIGARPWTICHHLLCCAMLLACDPGALRRTPDPADQPATDLGPGGRGDGAPASAGAAGDASRPGSTDGAAGSSALPDARGADASPLPVLPPYPHGDVAFRAALRAVGLFDVTDPRYKGGADHTGVKDSTAAIQAAMDDAFHHQQKASPDRGVTFFPPGSYRVSGTLLALGDRQMSRKNAHQLLGSTWNGARPRIVLAANASGFGDPQQPRPVLHFMACDVDKETAPGCLPSWELQKADPQIVHSDGNAAMNMAQGVRNLELVVEQGNAGAIGVRFAGAQDNILQQVKVTFAKDGFAGLYSAIGTNAVVTGLEIVGGKYGIHCGDSRWPSFNDVSLRDQQIYAITGLKSGGPLALSGFEIEKEQAPVIGDALSGTNYYSKSHSGGAYALSDGAIRLRKASSAQPAIENEKGRQITLQNVFFENATTITRNGTAAPVAGGPGWVRVDEYAAAIPGTSKQLIGGKLTNTDHLGSVVPAQAPPADLRRQHGVTMADFPTPDVLLQRIADGDASVVNVADHGIAPLSAVAANSPQAPDYAAKLQQLLSAPQVRFVLLPRGAYPIGKTVTLGSHVHLMGVANFLSEIVTHDKWRPTAQDPGVMLRTVDDAKATTKLSLLKLQWRVDPDRNWFTGIEWRAGRRSLYYNVMTRAGGSGRDQEYGSPKADHLVTGHGGGRFFGIGTGSGGWAKHHDGYRGLKIDGTCEPLTIYGLDPEDGHEVTGGGGFAQVEIVNAENVSVRGFKCEDHHGLRVQSSENLFALGVGGCVQWRLIDTQNALGMSFAAKFNDRGGYLVEQTTGGATISVPSSAALGVLKRGSVDFGRLKHF